jgi:hypothetical protein
MIYARTGYHPIWLLSNLHVRIDVRVNVRVRVQNCKNAHYSKPKAYPSKTPNANQAKGHKKSPHGAISTISVYLGHNTTIPL